MQDIIKKKTMDVGIVLKPMSFEIDVQASEARVEDYIQSWENQIKKEVKLLAVLQHDLVASDIFPWVFHALKQAHIKSVLISNFTWFEIYEEYLSPHLVKPYQDCYTLVDEVLMYNLSGLKMKERFVKCDEVSLCAR